MKIKNKKIKEIYEYILSLLSDGEELLYISGTDKADAQDTIELYYQFLNTLAITPDEFRPADLGLGWNSNPECDNRTWITKTTETEYYKLVGDYNVRREYFLKALESDDVSDRKKVYAKIIEKNSMFINEPLFAKELAEVISLLANVWLNPLVFSMSDEDIEKKCQVILGMMAMLGVDITDMYPAVYNMNKQINEMNNRK